MSNPKNDNNYLNADSEYKHITFVKIYYSDRIQSQQKIIIL